VSPALQLVVLGLALGTVGCSIVHAALRKKDSLVVTAAVFGLLLAISLGTVLVGMLRIPIQGVAPADKATILAAAISEALNCAAFSCVAFTLSVPGVVIGEVRRRRSR
jgi:hypothetical protein